MQRHAFGSNRTRLDFVFKSRPLARGANTHFIACLVALQHCTRSDNEGFRFNGSRSHTKKRKYEFALIISRHQAMYTLRVKCCSKYEKLQSNIKNSIKHYKMRRI